VGPPSLQRFLQASVRVSFLASDGVRLSGRMYGQGGVAVVLAHMGNPGDSLLDWYPLVLSFPRDRYSVLTFDRRGVCPGGPAGCSRGGDVYQDSWKDVAGAIRFVRQRGARAIVVGGASIGAMASLFALQRDQTNVNGFIWIAGLTDASGYAFTRESVRQLRLPTLIVSARSDPYLAKESARRLSHWLGLPKRLLLLPSDLHGTDMLSADAPAELRGRLVSAIRAFVEDVT